ncbi:MAG: hypothetical protein GXO49_03165 [Chlorobi bacterium]|nr:hypothetical protein [Chlorobiota bacterium]
MEDFNVFAKAVADTVNSLSSKLKIEKNDSQNMIVTTNELTFKIKRKKPAIGVLPELKKKTKWKKEKIRITAAVKEGKYCVNFDAVAYNKKDKKWHEVAAPSDFFEKILDNAYLQSLKGKVVWTVGSPLVIVNGGAEKLTNLKKFKVEDAYISYASSKAVEFVLRNDEGLVVTASVPFIGDVKSVEMAYKAFSKKFVSSFPKQSVPSKYDFFWEYAIHGELMDGMHKNQLLTAFGVPVSIEKSTNYEFWHYFVDGKKLVFKIYNNELQLPDDYKW